MPGDPGPLRPVGGQEQPSVKARAIRGLKIINSLETAATQDATKGKQACGVEGRRSGIDGDLVEEPALLGELGESGSCQQRDFVCDMVPSNSRCRPKRLDKVSKRTELDDEDLAPRRSWHRRNPPR